MGRAFFIVCGLVLAAGAATLWFMERGTILEGIGLPKIGSPWIGSLFADDNEVVSSRKIEKGMVFASVAESFGLATSEIAAILESAKDKYDLAKIVEGREISFVSHKDSGRPIKLVYQIDSEEALILKRNGENLWNAARVAIPYEIEVEEIAGEIESSLFETITQSGGDDRVALALAEIFAWQIDFGADIRVGDQFKVIYEKRFVNGNYAGPGRILAARFVNDGKVFQGIYFASSDGKEGYYDENGDSLQKIFLKSPLSYRYISSGFSYNRLNPVSRTLHAHRAIDYAASHGTPVVTVGDGTAAYAGWKGGLGIIVQVRHNDTYTTVYAHLSRAAVRTGSKVEQGQIIGYVGATGEATGPHLHFEMYKNGGYVNPFTIELPPGEAVKDADRPSFENTVGQYREFLES